MEALEQQAGASPDYAQFDPAEMSGAAEAMLERLDDRALCAQLTVLVREYARRFESGNGSIGAPVDSRALSATEVVITASELIRAMDLNLFDVAMWFRRPLPVWNETQTSRREG